MRKYRYKQDNILDTSASMSDVHLRPPRAKRTKLKLVMLAAILSYVGFTVNTNSAKAFYQHVTVECDKAEEIIVLGTQPTFWRKKIGSTIYHNHIMYTHTKNGAGQVQECFHANDVTNTPQQYVVRCVSNGVKD